MNDRVKAVKNLITLCFVIHELPHLKKVKISLYTVPKMIKVIKPENNSERVKCYSNTRGNVG